MNQEELLMIVGGSVTGTFLNALARSINSFLDIGRSLGTTLRRLFSGCVCAA